MDFKREGLTVGLSKHDSRAYLLPCTGLPSGPVTLAASRPL